MHLSTTDLPALHLVVADQDVHVTSTKLTDSESLPYEPFTGINIIYNEFIAIHSDAKDFPRLSVPPADDLNSLNQAGTRIKHQGESWCIEGLTFTLLF